MGTIDCKRKDELKAYLKKFSVLIGDFTLASGKKSNFYIDCRKTTLYGPALMIIGEAVYGFMDDAGVDYIGGMSIGADPIIAAAITVGSMHHNVIKGLMVRKAAKDHGLKQIVEGQLPEKGVRVLLVDDVATSGGSLVSSANTLMSMGCVIEDAVVIVDREEGADKLLSDMGIRLHSIFKKGDFV